MHYLWSMLAGASICRALPAGFELSAGLIQTEEFLQNLVTDSVLTHELADLLVLAPDSPCNYDMQYINWNDDIIGFHVAFGVCDPEEPDFPSIRNEILDILSESSEAPQIQCVACKDDKDNYFSFAFGTYGDRVEHTWCSPYPLTRVCKFDN